MARIPDVTRDGLPEEQRAAFDEVIASAGGAMPGGPGSIAIHSPELSRRRTGLSNYLRYETTIPNHVLELAILITARHMDCAYVWNAHAAAARKAGVTDALVDAIRDRQPLPAAPDDESTLLNFATELFKTNTVSAATFQAALDQLGRQHLVELTAVLGAYVQNAFFLNAFGVDLPAERTEPLLQV